MRCFAAVLGLFCATSLSAQTVTIDFDDLGPNQVVGSHYVGLGVYFLNAKIAPDRVPVLPPFGTYPGASFPSTIVSMEEAFNGFQPQPDNPIISYFSFDASSVTVTGLGVNEHGFLLRAYDAEVGGNLVDSQQVFGPGSPPDDIFYSLTVSGQRIRRVEISQVLQLNAPQNYDDTWFDNLVITHASAVPEPSTMASLAVGIVFILGLTAARRRGGSDRVQ